MEPIRNRSGVYYTKSDLNQFQLRVCLREISTTEILRNPDVLESFAGMKLSHLQREGPQPINKEQYEEVIIKWQEKILSTNEVLEYERPKYKKGNFKVYHKLAIAKKKKNPTRIFTYIQSDNFEHGDLPATTSVCSEQTENVLRNRFRKMSFKEQRNASSQDEVSQRVEKKFFYIMADLAQRENLGDNTEDHVVLCKLRFDGKSQIIADPDLSKKGQIPRRIEGLRKGNSIFEYSVEMFKAQKASPKIEDRKEVREPQLMENFDRLSPDEMRIVFAGELTRCVNFLDTNGAVFIHYQIDLPEGWMADNDCQLSGISEACYQTWGLRKSVGHFSLPLYFSLRRKRNAEAWPSIIFSVFSRDWLTFDRDQGFAVFRLPYPGLNPEVEFEVQTWRPSQISPTDQLYRFFIGGANLLRNASYLTTHNQGTLMSRLGFITESSGFLELRIHSLLQTSLEMQQEVSIKDADEQSYFHPTTMAVIKAFHKSFTRLRAAKQQI